MVRKKVFWKDICKSFSASKGRFLSIMLLMLLGSLVLTGLKVTPQDMQRTADHYLNTHKTMDLSVIASAGFSKEDQKELDHIKGGHVEYGYMSDVTIKDTEDAVVFFLIARISPLMGSYPVSCLGSHLKLRYHQNQGTNIR